MQIRRGGDNRLLTTRNTPEDVLGVLEGLTLNAGELSEREGAYIFRIGGDAEYRCGPNFQNDLFSLILMRGYQAFNLSESAYCWTCTYYVKKAAP